MDSQSPFRTPELWQKYCKYKQHLSFSCFGFDPLLGLILEVFWESKWRPKPSKSHLKKTCKKWFSKWPQTGPKGGPKMEPKSLKMRSWKHLASRVAPKWLPDPLQDRFWRGFGTIFVSFWTYFWWCLHAFCSSMLQTKTFKIMRKHQKNAAESSQEAASLFVPSCIEKLTGERQWAFRSLLVQVETGQMSAAETGQMLPLRQDKCKVLR